MSAVASATTWLFVRMYPSLETTKPLPPEIRSRWLSGSGKFRKNPLWGREGCPWRLASILTTAGVTMSATCTKASLSSTAGLTASTGTCGSVSTAGIEYVTPVHPSAEVMPSRRGRPMPSRTRS